MKTKTLFRAGAALEVLTGVALLAVPELVVGLWREQARLLGTAGCRRKWTFNPRIFEGEGEK